MIPRRRREDDSKKKKKKMMMMRGFRRRTSLSEMELDGVEMQREFREEEKYADDLALSLSRQMVLGDEEKK